MLKDFRAILQSTFSQGSPAEIKVKPWFYVTHRRDPKEQAWEVLDEI